MACATLKRNLDWDAQKPAKRRRCSPITPSSSTSPSTSVKVEAKNGVFGETVSASVKMTPERMAQEIYNEIIRLHRRRQLRLATGAAASCSSSSGSEGDASPPHASAHTQKERIIKSKALFTFKQVRMICERMLREQEAAIRAEYESALSSKLNEQYQAFVRFNIDQVQSRPPAATCMPLGMDAEHNMHQDLVPSYLS